MTSIKKFIDQLQGRPAAVLGLGSSGLSVVKALKKGGAEVIAWDDSEEARAAAEKAGAVIKALDKDVLGACECLIVAPGVPLKYPEPHPAVIAAQEAGIEIIGDIEIFYRAHPDTRTIGVTGTNGKSTTAALLHHVLEASGVSTGLGGNIGKPVLDLKLPAKDGYMVLELSSFQLDLCRSYAPDIAIWVNVSADHIDRHGSMEGYVAAKERIFARPDQAVIIGVDDKYSAAVYERLKGEEGRRVIPISTEKEISGGVYAIGGVLYDATQDVVREIGSLNNILTLPGVHNKQNAAAAYAAARIAGLEPAAILEAMQSYPGLAHRQFTARIISGVAYINDSKATNADSAARALACHQNIYWIVGGRKKEGGLNGLETFMNRVKHAFVIGESMDEFVKWLEGYNVPATPCKTMDIAVSHAHRLAQEGRGQPGGAGVVLLSPACASYDQYKSYAHRGDVFTDLVNALPEEDVSA